MALQTTRNSHLWKTNTVITCFVVYVYVCIYIYIYVRIGMRVCAHICTCVNHACIYIYKCANMRVYTYVYTHTHTCIYIHIYTYVCTYIHTYISIYIYMCVCICMCAHTYIDARMGPPSISAQVLVAPMGPNASQGPPFLPSHHCIHVAVCLSSWPSLHFIDVDPQSPAESFPLMRPKMP